MNRDQELVREITKNAYELPLECKKQVQSLMEAMIFTKGVVTKNKKTNHSQKQVG